MSGVEIATLAVAVGSQVVGARKQSKAAKAQADASREQIAAQQRAEAARKRQAELQASRERRKAIRNTIIARADALSTITNRGAGPGSSVVGGTLGQFQGSLGQQITDINQNEFLGSEVFAANEQAAAAGDRINRARVAGSEGEAFSSFGATVARNFGPITRIGNSLTNNFPSFNSGGTKNG